jgi:predicted MFS family arabinose efflux permease
VLRRLAHLIFGAQVERALKPVLVVTLIGSIAGSSAWNFMGIWAIKELGATSAQLSYGYLLTALVGGVVGYLAGHLSDRFGRRRLILVGDGLQAVYVLLFLTVGNRVWYGIALMVGAAALGSFGGSAGQAMVADLVPEERHEEAYASVRVAANLGVTMGPPIGSLFLLLGGWTVFFPCVSLLAASAWVLAFRYLPKRGAYAPEGPPERGSFGVIRRDRVFLVFLAASVFAWVVYVAYETVLPISLVESHGVPEWGWGLLLVVNPLLVTVFQLRLTRRVTHVPAARKWAVAMLLMGFPFLLFGLSSMLPLIVFVLVVFVIGEMLWVPTSQSIVAGLAPDDLRGAYMGAFGGTAAAGFALAPFVGLQVRGAAGDTAMWGAFAVAAVVAVILGVVAVRGTSGPAAGRRARSPGSAVLEG